MPTDDGHAAGRARTTWRPRPPISHRCWPRWRQVRERRAAAHVHGHRDRSERQRADLLGRQPAHRRDLDPAGAFSWTPTFAQAGNYNVTITVTDNGSPAASDFEIVTITVGNVNRPPVLAPIGAKTVNEGQLLTFTVTATDPDGEQR